MRIHLSGNTNNEKLAACCGFPARRRCSSPLAGDELTVDENAVIGIDDKNVAVSLHSGFLSASKYDKKLLPQCSRRLEVSPLDTKPLHFLFAILIDRIIALSSSATYWIAPDQGRNTDRAAPTPPQSDRKSVV